MFALFAIISHIDSHSLSFRITYENGYISEIFLCARVPIFKRSETDRDRDRDNETETEKEKDRKREILCYLGFCSHNVFAVPSLFSLRQLFISIIILYQCHKETNKRKRHR